VQLVAVTQSTAISAAFVEPARFGTATRCHCEPLPCSANDWGPALPEYRPTATQCCASVQDTSSSSLCDDFAASGDNDQLAPFHCSTSAESPTAKHADALGQASSSSSEKGVAAGLVATDQVVPFHCSLSGVKTRPSLAAVTAPPTAEQCVALVQAMPKSAPPSAPGARGTLSTENAVPFQCSA